MPRILSCVAPGSSHERTFGQKLWQGSYHDHVLRDEETTVGVARCIVENPIRAGLVTRVEDYPFVGSDVMSLEALLDSAAV